MATENQKTKEEIAEKVFSVFRNEEGDYSLGYDVNGDREMPITWDKSEAKMKMAAKNLNELYATLPAQSSDAVELLEWIHKNDYRPCIINGTQKAFTSNITRLDVSIEQLLSIFLKEKGAHNG